MAAEEDQLTPEELVDLVHHTDEQMRRTLGRMLAPRARREGGEEHIEQLRQLLAVASPHHVKDVMLHRMRQEKLYVGRGLSFMGHIVAKTEVARLGGRLPARSLTDKQPGFEFIDTLGMRRPATDGVSRPFAEVEITPGTVIKPARGSGSKGCYLVFDTDEIFHAKDGKKFTTREDLQTHAYAILRDRSSATSAKKDEWTTEELILSDRETRAPAIDLKFWSFYGEIAFVSEINRYPETRWDFWSPEGERIEAPGGWKVTRHEGLGFTPEDLEIAKKISLAIPYPFMRIDMLRGDGELVFGEFTPRPGSSNVLTPEWDRRMGEMWGLAENRIQQDLLAGKEFTEYKQFMRELKKKRRAARRKAAKSTTEAKN
ncbi:ATP-grasp fold amidoligase family protein [Nesterenkonia alba]|uniref:ATP-grasp fold amidoligase family protein n=1 Tax=Nesterenkonia alba TaxID=515814 RepID=UPI0003B51CCB|nr:ATP-grasp fold amidoligase family protein [Nesterenkonia alba]